MKEDITGQQFNMLTVLNYSHSDGNSAWWRCICECGKLVVLRKGNINNKNNMSCRCYRNRRGNLNLAFKGVGKLGFIKFNKIKDTAKRKNIDFNITIDYAWDLFVQQEEKCKYTGELITITSSAKYRGNASLDRIDNTQGYIEGNLQWILSDINYMKGTLSEPLFLYYCELISKNDDNKS